MLSLLIISAITGLCLAQDVGEYSDCPRLNEIMTKTCESNLTYLKTLHSDSYNYFMEISKLKDPVQLVQTVNIEKACKESDHLRQYYKCVYTEVKSCLVLVNSTQSLGVPNPDKMAEAIASICENQKEINGTCYQSRKDAAITCDVQKRSSATKANAFPPPANLQNDQMGVDEEEGDEEEVMAVDVKYDSSVQSQGNQEAYQTYTQLQKELICGLFEAGLECMDEAMSDCLGYEPIVREMYIASLPEMCDSSPSSSAVPAASLAASLLFLLPVLCHWLQA